MKIRVSTRDMFPTAAPDLVEEYSRIVFSQAVQDAMVEQLGEEQIIDVPLEFVLNGERIVGLSHGAFTIGAVSSSVYTTGKEKEADRGDGVVTTAKEESRTGRSEAEDGDTDRR